MDDTALEEERPLGQTRKRLPIPWFTLALVGVSFFLIEHRMDASLQFQQLMAAQSLDEVEGTGLMYESQPARQFGGLFLGLFGVLCVLQRGRMINRPLGLLGGLILGYAAWTIISLAWAVDFGVTFRRLAMFLCMGMAAVAIGARFAPRDVMRMSIVIPGAYLVLGLWAEIRNGTFTPSVSGYRFAGTIHPNIEAIDCALLFMGAVCLWAGAEKTKKRHIVLILVAGYFLYLTKSRTALAATAFALLVFWVYAIPMSRKLAVTFSAAAAFCLFLLCSSALMPGMEEAAKMGRSDVSDNFASFTGRRALWSQLWEFVQGSPLLGYGYAGFWSPENADVVMERQGWPISHAHNAYMDALLEAGPVSLVLLVLILILAIRTARRFYRRTGDWGYAYATILLLFCAANSFLESAAKQRTFVAFVVMVALSLLAFHEQPPGMADREPGGAPAEEGT